jgi:hypothetical protein
VALGGEGDGARGEVAGAAGAASAGVAGSLPEGDVDGPVGAARLAELPGPVQRVDDPDPVRGQPRRVVGALLGQDDVAGTAGGERRGQELVRPPVAGLAQQVRLAARGPQLEQQLPRLGGQVPGQFVIVSVYGAGSSAW